MNREDEVQGLIQDRVIHQGGHYILQSGSGKHSADYVSHRRLIGNPIRTAKMCKSLAEELQRAQITKPDTILTPQDAPIALSQWMAKSLMEMNGTDIRVVYAERNLHSGRFFINSEYHGFIMGKKVEVIDDVLATGRTLNELNMLVDDMGGSVVANGVLINRGNISTNHIRGTPVFHALLDVHLGDLWNSFECPLCRSLVDINVDVGFGREFENQRQIAFQLQ